jgi:hypothetical protein
MDLIDCFHNPIHVDPNIKLSLEMNSPLLVASTITFYRIGVSKFFHVTNICPDIAYFVGVVTRFIIAPCKAHLEVVILIFFYLKGSLDFALHY